MQFAVPQFIDIEDKIIGPLTLKQFFYLAGGAGFFLVLFFILRLAWAIVLSFPVVVASFALAFLKIDEVPLPKFLASFIRYAFKPQEYLWKK